MAMEQLHSSRPEVGADTTALALHALAVAMERCRLARLTRNQHVLFRLGELIAWAECSGALAKRASDAIENRLDQKADRRFSADALCAMARVMGRETAMKVAMGGMQLVTGAEGGSGAEFTDTMNIEEIIQEQKGAIEDMNYIADVLYDRKK
jgi:alkylation response protein AidB-like acyl-CoA dehydrogenase